MSKFFVGQRVRIVRTYNYPQMRGVEARIMGFYRDAWDGRKHYDGLELSVRTPHGAPYVALPDELEPILPEGHRAGDYSFHELMDRCREGVAA